jgi:heme/copper-type cytochrome/quinol oxidase subunit 2
MSLVASAVLAAAGSIEEQPLPVPSVIFPIVALGVFALLALVAWSYRDVANSHTAKPDRGSHVGH